jgi:membrane protease YdiL (CAAX protease family)
MRDVSIATVPARESPGRRRSAWTWLAAFEVLLAAAFVLLDLAIPSVLLVLLAAASLAVRRQGPSSLGFHRPRRDHLVVGTAAFAVVWSVFQLGVTMPVASHLSGEEQDVGVFADVEGDLALLLLLLVLSWTLGALVEEVAFRGFLLTRLREVLGHGHIALTVAVLVSSVLFGALHSEQGIVGVLAVTLDGAVFCLLRLYYGTVWAAVLAHGFNNTLGLVTFYLVGPVYGLW